MIVKKEVLYKQMDKYLKATFVLFLFVCYKRLE